MSKITCQFCNGKFGVRKYNEHLSDCIKKSQSDIPGYLIEFVGYSGVTNKKYTMYGLFGLKCKFSHIDKFIRMHWCECCDHISSFTTQYIDKAYIEKMLKDNDKIAKIIENDDVFKNLFVKEIKIKPNCLISKYENTDFFDATINGKSLQYQFEYEYDPNSPTQIIFKIISKCDDDKKVNKNAKEKNDLSKMVYMNSPPVVKCSCKKIATYVLEYEPFCVDCIGNIRIRYNIDYDSDNDTNDDINDDTNDDENSNNIDVHQFLSPIVNSPRVGICGYGKN